MVIHWTYGNYKTTCIIGRGNGTIVMRAVHKPTGVNYAMKIVARDSYSLSPNPQFEGGGDDAASSVMMAKDQEGESVDAHATQKSVDMIPVVSNRHLVNVVDIMQTKEHYLVVEELMKGGELFDRLVSKKRFDDDTARMYFRQVLCAVRACHKQGVVLNNIRSENLLLVDVDKSEVKLSANLTFQASSHWKQDTLHYAAPEHFRESPAAPTAASDMWSCGVVLYVMIEGRLPFNDTSVAVCIEKIKRGLYEPMTHVFQQEGRCLEGQDASSGGCTSHSSVRDLVARLLVTDPTSRLTVDEALSHPWLTRGGGGGGGHRDESQQCDSNVGCSTDAVVDNSVATSVVPVIQVEPIHEGSTIVADADTQSAFTFITTLMQQVAMSMGKDPVKLIGNEKPFFTFCGSVDAALHCTHEVAKKREWNMARKKGSHRVHGFSNTAQGFISFEICATGTLSETTTIMSIRRQRGPNDAFQEFKAELLEALRVENSWCWRLHCFCQPAVRLAVCWLHSGMMYRCNKTGGKLPLPSEVASEVCSWLRVPYVVAEATDESWQTRPPMRYTHS